MKRLAKVFVIAIDYNSTGVVTMKTEDPRDELFEHPLDPRRLTGAVLQEILDMMQCLMTMLMRGADDDVADEHMKEHCDDFAEFVTRCYYFGYNATMILQTFTSLASNAEVFRIVAKQTLDGIAKHETKVSDSRFISYDEAIKRLDEIDAENDNTE